MNITRAVTCSSLAAMAIAGCLGAAANTPANTAPRGITVPDDGNPFNCTPTPGTQICIGFVYTGPTLKSMQMDQEGSSAISGVTYWLTGPDGWTAEGGPYSSNGPGWLPQLTAADGSGGPGNYCADSYAGGLHLGRVCMGI